jgi:hypothetical protein
MNDASELYDSINNRPFVPFSVILSTGEEIPIRHPEVVWLSDSSLLVIDPVDPETRRLAGYRLIGIDHIVQIKNAAREAAVS